MELRRIFPKVMVEFCCKSVKVDVNVFTVSDNSCDNEPVVLFVAPLIKE
jgi:hypothetical protein